MMAANGMPRACAYWNCLTRAPFWLSSTGASGYNSTRNPAVRNSVANARHRSARFANHCTTITSAGLATSDGGATWTQQFNAAAEQRPLLDVLFVDPQNGMAVGAYGAFYETSDGGKSWNPRKVIEDDKHLNAFIRLPDGKLVILGETGTILRTPGLGWKRAG